MKQAKKQRNKRGFTMAEMLTVIAIFAILAAVAFPAVAQVQKRMGIAKLDEYARQIFLSAQNEITAMKASGRLEEFSKKLSVSNQVTLRPADYPADSDKWKELYVVSATSQVAQDYLLRAGYALSDAVEGGDFLLEMNPATGDVYSAFYAKDLINYADVQTACEVSRERRFRQDALLGYYGGSLGGSGAVGVPSTFDPSVEVVNGEELYLNITCGDLLLLRGTQRYLTLLVTVADEHGGIWEKTFAGGSDMMVTSDSVTVPLVLDSLDPAHSFAAITEGQLTPGDNLTITAAMTYTNNSVTITGAATTMANSLFGDRGENGAIGVSRLRHLNNLRGAIYLAPGRTAVITQTGPIDFDLKRWTKINGHNPYHSAWTINPLTTFVPINNLKLLTNASYDGMGNTITGFPISGSSDVGLFASVANSTLQNIRLVDFSVVATGDRAGALAGQASNTTVDNCGVYLTSLDEYGRLLLDMDARLARYTVTGATHVGGLIGQTSGTTNVKNSFAALSVIARDTVGGLLGACEAGEIRNCYASGDVTATGTGNAGGLLGVMGTSTVSGCYSTAQVTAATNVGGLVGGSSSGSKIQDSRVYGRVETQTPNPTAGGVVGGGSAACTGCKYMSQAGYNEGFKTRPGDPTAYLLLKANPPNAKETARPYQGALVGSPFPFPQLSIDAVPITHHGNWPAEFRLQTSLVYYEKYLDDSYGYYARTSLTTEGVEQTANTWVVDTLKEQVCKEDGYALLTTASLTEFHYSRNGKAAQAVTVSEKVSRENATPLDKNVSLTFKNDEGAMYSVSGTNVYRLPYTLQTTGHNSNGDRFFDKLTVTGAGDKKEYTFYYCADLGKNAVNPDLTTAASDYPDDPNGEKNPVYVRSARQLNLIGRTTYYWSKNNSAYDFYFLQETEVDFGKYVKNYCGEPYDMMDTQESNPHRNLPIGRPGGDIGQRFQAVYDGGGNAIVDFRCVTYEKDRYQFTGLFGEVYQATLKNIVMTASDPDGKSGYVESQFVGDGLSAGVGALVGLVYLMDSATNSQPYASVSNCAVSGYTVQYTGRSQVNCAVGGLAGYTFGAISNSSAVSKLVNATEGGGGKFVGGLVGSLNGLGAITNCYTGGELAIKSNTASRNVGGISGGFNDIYGYGFSGDSRVKRVMSIAESYSTCTLSAENITSSWGNTPKVYGVSPAMNYLTIQNAHYLSDTVRGIDVIAVNGVTAQAAQKLAAQNFSGGGKATAENTHPWSTTLNGLRYSYPAFVKSDGASFVHYGDWYSTTRTGDGAWLAYYEAYADGTYGYYGFNASTAYNTLDSANSQSIRSAGYGVFSEAERNFSLLRPDVDNAFVASAKIAEPDSLTELQSGGTIYYLYPLTETWAGNLRGKDSTACVKTTFRCENANETMTDRSWYVNTSFAAEIQSSNIQGTAGHPFQIRTPEQLQQINYYISPWLYQQTHDVVNAASAGYITVSSGQTYDGNGYAIFGLRKALFDVNNGTLKNIRLAQTNVSESGSTAALCLTNNHSITNCSASGTVTSTNASAAGLVYSNAGTGKISSSYANCRVVSTVGNAAAFVWSQGGGAIENCYAVGSVETENGNAHGFKGVGLGQLSNCYTVAALSGKSWYPMTPNASETLTNCYWAGDMNHSGTKGNSVGTEKSLKEMETIQMGSAFETAKANNSHPDSAALQGKAYPYPKLSTQDHWGDWPVANKGQVGAFQLYNERYNRNKYHLNGIGVDTATGTVIETYTGGYQETTIYGVLFDSDAFGDGSNWSVKYHYTFDDRNNNEQQGEGQLNFPLKAETVAGLQNGTDRKLCTFLLPTPTKDRKNVELTKITLTNTKNQNSYTFVYDDGTFTY